VRRIERQLEGERDVSAVKKVRARTVGSSALVDVGVTTTSGLSSSALRGGISMA